MAEIQESHFNYLTNIVCRLPVLCSLQESIFGKNILCFGKEFWREKLLKNRGRVGNVQSDSKLIPKKPLQCFILKKVR